MSFLRLFGKKDKSSSSSTNGRPKSNSVLSTDSDSDYVFATSPLTEVTSSSGMSVTSSRTATTSKTATSSRLPFFRNNSRFQQSNPGLLYASESVPLPAPPSRAAVFGRFDQQAKVSTQSLPTSPAPSIAPKRPPPNPLQSAKTPSVKSASKSSFFSWTRKKAASSSHGDQGSPTEALAPPPLPSDSFNLRSFRHVAPTPNPYARSPSPRNTTPTPPLPSSFARPPRTESPDSQRVTVGAFRNSARRSQSSLNGTLDPPPSLSDSPRRSYESLTPPRPPRAPPPGSPSSPASRPPSKRIILPLSSSSASSTSSSEESDDDSDDDVTRSRAGAPSRNRTITRSANGNSPASTTHTRRGSADGGAPGRTSKSVDLSHMNPSNRGTTAPLPLSRRLSFEHPPPPRSATQPLPTSQPRRPSVDQYSARGTSTQPTTPASSQPQSRLPSADQKPPSSQRRPSVDITSPTPITRLTAQPLRSALASSNRASSSSFQVMSRPAPKSAHPTAQSQSSQGLPFPNSRQSQASLGGYARSKASVSTPSLPVTRPLPPDTDTSESSEEEDDDDEKPASRTTPSGSAASVSSRRKGASAPNGRASSTFGTTTSSSASSIKSSGTASTTRPRPTPLVDLKSPSTFHAPLPPMPTRPLHQQQQRGSPATSSTGADSAPPVTPRDGSLTHLPSANGNGSGVEKGKHVKRHSVTFVDLEDEEKDSGVERERERKERRRSEARNAIELGKVVNGPAPVLNDDDEEMVPPPRVRTSSMIGSGMGTPPLAMPMNMGQMPMGMGFPGSPASPFPVWPQQQSQPGTPTFPMQMQMPMLDPNFLAAHQQAMLIAKQTYQYAVAQQAMAEAGEMWERGSAVSGWGGGGGGGSGSMIAGWGGGGGSVYGGAFGPSVNMRRNSTFGPYAGPYGGGASTPFSGSRYSLAAMSMGASPMPSLPQQPVPQLPAQHHQRQSSQQLQQPPSQPVPQRRRTRTAPSSSDASSLPQPPMPSNLRKNSPPSSWRN